MVTRVKRPRSHGATAPKDHPLQNGPGGGTLLLIALAACVLFHGGLLPFTHGNTYDAFIHMFFGDHYTRSWFDPWEPRWYTGFATTSYPPGTHMAIGALQHLIPLRAAFVVVMLAGLLILTVGIYRYAMLWVPAQAAGYAAIALVLASSIAETVHVFGQLPTIFSLGLFLNGMPYVYRWIVLGRLTNFVAAVIFAAATTAAHHVTTLFGAVLFIVPLAFQCLRAVAETVPAAGAGAWAWTRRFLWPFGRGLILAAAIPVAMVLTIFPYWYWSVTDPITQVSIPHGSRESFIERLDMGLMFFVLPWGASLPFLAYVIYKGVTTRLWPLAGAVLLCFVLGTGGTTPIPRLILRGAFDILTLDRFTFWATILILPFIGMVIAGLLHGRAGESMDAAFGRGAARVVATGILGSQVVVAVGIALLPTFRPIQPKLIDPGPIVAFMEQDEHWRWRYLTLGFGDQFAYVSAQMTAQSVDGNYHSARRLPDMTNYAVERLENSKYLGVPGLGSLRQFLENADRYHLKYVFSNDAFYDPLLYFSGWNRLIRLENGVFLWEKPDVPPLPTIQRRKTYPPAIQVWWGVVPPTVLLLAAAALATAALSRGFSLHRAELRPVREPQKGFANLRLVRRVVLGLGTAAVFVLVVGGTWAVNEWRRPLGADERVEAFFGLMDFRQHRKAWEMLDPATRQNFEDTLFMWRWRGGLQAWYGKLTDLTATPLAASDHLIDWEVTLDWLTPLDKRQEKLRVRTVKRGEEWYLLPNMLRPVQTPVRLQRAPDVAWNVTGRRQPLADTDIHRDRADRPELVVGPLAMVRHKGRWSVVGYIGNADSDPAHLTVQASLHAAEGAPLAQQWAGQALSQRLLPTEGTGFRVQFEGVLSLQDAALEDGFDPLQFIPPTLAAAPDHARAEIRALAQAEGLYRGVSLNGLTAEPVAEGLRLRATAVNTGVETATIVRVTVLLMDGPDRPVWVDAGYVDTNIYPGQSAPFEMILPARETIEVIGPVPGPRLQVNGTSPIPRELADRVPEAALIPLRGVAGHGAMVVQISSLTHEPEF